MSDFLKENFMLVIYLIGILIGINLLTFLLYRIDKWKAR